MSQTKLETIRQNPKSLLLQLSGNWTLDAGVPDTEDLEKRMQNDSIKHIAFNTSEVNDWDSGLFTWLISLVDYCREHKISLDMAGLPDGVDRLLELANAVPERKGAQRGESKLLFISKVGENFIASARITGEFVDFFWKLPASAIQID